MNATLILFSTVFIVLYIMFTAQESNLMGRAGTGVLMIKPQYKDYRMVLIKNQVPNDTLECIFDIKEGRGESRYPEAGNLCVLHSGDIMDNH